MSPVNTEEMIKLSEEFDADVNISEVVSKYPNTLGTMAICIGQAGGNVARKLLKKGALTVAVNSSRDDLSTTEAHLKVLIEGFDGSGKNRDIGFDMFNTSPREILKNIIRFIEEQNPHTIVVIGAGTGGTASGILPPILAILQNQYGHEKLVYGAGIIGTISEDETAQRNAKAFLREIEERSNAPYMLFDNGSVNSLNFTEVCDTINTKIADVVACIDGYHYKPSSILNLDPKDRKTLFLPGRFVATPIKTIAASVKNNTNIEAEIMKHFESNGQVEIGETVRHYGAYISTQDFAKFDTDFTKLQNIYGDGPVFKHIQGFSEEVPELVLVMAGLDAPINRYSIIQQKLSEVSFRGTEALPQDTVTNKPSFAVSSHEPEKKSEISDILAGFKR